jgi:CHAT domain-containing protein
MRARIAVPLLTVGAILAIALSYQAYRDRRQPNDPDWLLRHADEQAWLNEWINAAPVYHRAELLYQDRNEPAKALYAHVSQMMATSEMSSFAPQIASLSGDLQLPAASDPETRLRILTIRGMLETNYDAGLATKTWTEVGELARKQHHYMLASRAMGEEGIAAFLLGDVNGAQAKVMKAYLVAKYVGDPAARVRYASVYGAGLVALKKYDRALKPLDEAIRVANTTKGVAYPSIATSSKIEALSGLGRYQEAITLTNDAMARVAARNLNMHISELLRVRAGIYERTRQAKLATDDYRAAIDIGKKVSDWGGLLQTGGSLAALYEEQGRLEDALHAIDDAIDANKQIPDELYFMPRNISIKARILARLGRTRESNTLYQKSSDLIDSLLAHAPTANVERELITSMQQVYAGYFDSLCSQNKFAEAFRTIEKARGRFEAQSLEHVEAAPPRPASDLDQKLVRLNLALLNTDDPAQRATIVDQIGETEGRLPSEFLEGKTAIDPVSLAQLQADLGQNQVLVEYVLDDPRSYALCITRTAVNRYVLPPKQTLEEEARDYRSSLTQRKPDAATGQKLFQQLLGNIPAYTRNTEVILVPDGELHLLPFGALIDGSHYVIESHTLAVSPSGTVFHILKEREGAFDAKSHPYVGVAAWTQVKPSPFERVLRAVNGPKESEFVPLPESKKEVETAGADLPKPSTILLGADATETRFKELPLDQYQVLHLALHGYVDPIYPDRSALVFAPEKNGPNDGLLQVREIRQMRLGASLVTLSACDTGIGPAGAAGINNLVTAFIDGGARSVVSTLWELEDHSTTRLMTNFYANLKTESKAQALRGAQLELLRAGFSPYFWASFELVGDPDNLVFGGLNPPSSSHVTHGQVMLQETGRRPL